MKKIINWIKEDFFYILFIVITFLVCNIGLPYHVLSPGGVMDINNRIKVDNKYETKGTLDLLYVAERKATIPTYLLSFILRDWDLESVDNIKVSDESEKDIELRNSIMLNNSLQNAIFSAYNKAEKTIKVNGQEIIVIATLQDNGLEIGDVILKANGVELKDSRELITIIDSCDDKLNLVIKRKNKEQEIVVPVVEENNVKHIGIVYVTNYDYDLDPELKLEFKNKEGGASGGLMIALNIYNSLIEEDITYSHKIAGTGTIDMYGNVGEIDGVKYKIIGAYKSKMELVFVPQENYEEANKVVKERNYKMKVVGVSTFDEAVDYLEKNYK